MKLDTPETTTILVTSLVLLVSYSLWVTIRPRRFPPGPRLVPFVGNILSLKAPLYEHCVELAKVYGDVFSLYFGTSYKVVVVNKFSLIKEALVDKAKIFAGRPYYQYRMKYYNPNRIGIIDGTYTKEWRSQRSVVMSMMRSIGYGRQTTEEKIRDECAHLIQVFKETSGQPYNPLNMVRYSVTNVIFFFLFGERFDYRDPEFQQLMKLTSDFNTYFTKDAEGDQIVPLRLLPSHQRSVRYFKQACEELVKFVNGRVEKCRATKAEGTQDGQPGSFISAYLDEVQKSQQGESKITENWITNIVLDFFVAGSDTTSSTLMWAMAYMVKYPQIQEKVQQEIDQAIKSSDEKRIDVVPSTGEEVTCLLLKHAVPYVQATLLEIHRYCALAVVGVPRETMTDVELGGYLLPKGSEVWMNWYQVSRDPDLWENPDEFRPERFLNDAGEVVKPEYWIPFSMGRRACPGEQLTKQELFIFFTTLMRNFTLTAADGSNDISLEPGDIEFLRQIKPYEICFVPRKH